MKVLKTIMPRKILALIASLLAVVFMLPCFSFLRVSAEEESTESVIYIDTEVEGIAYSQHPTVVFFGFGLTESDYDDFELYEGDYGGKEPYARYEAYLWSLSYWRDFASMNSEWVKFDQLYAYWNGSSVGPAKFANTVAHRSTLKLLEYGFVISIPKGTTFPSLTYVKGGCNGTPIVYRTTENKAFYFDGTGFKPLGWHIVEARTNALELMESVDRDAYYPEEREMVDALIEETIVNIKLSISTLAVEETINNFNAKISQIMDKEGYKNLNDYKLTVKGNLANYFNGLVESEYDAEEWAIIENIRSGYVTLVDAATSNEEVKALENGVKYAAEKVLKATEKADFEAYRAAMAAKVENSFDAALYREAERAQGEALAAEGKQLVEKAVSYDEVDGVATEYIASIKALKTDAEWTQEETNREEENAKPENSGKEENSSNEGKESGCQSAAGATGVMLGMAVLAASVILKNKKRIGHKDEE